MGLGQHPSGWAKALSETKSPLDLVEVLRGSWFDPSPHVHRSQSFSQLEELLRSLGHLPDYLPPASTSFLFCSSSAFPTSCRHLALNNLDISGLFLIFLGAAVPEN